MEDKLSTTHIDPTKLSASGLLHDKPKFPGTPTVIHGNGAVAHVMQHV